MEKEEAVAYQEALDYLYQFVDYSLVRNFRNSPEKFDLGRMEALLDLLGNPHRKYPVVHVAGTKGKGSTAALISRSLLAAGHKTGFYTSPHLQDFTERFQINGQQISRGELVDQVNVLKPNAEKLERITWFELTTALAFLWFERQKVDIAVIEVGLGGRLDATNVVDPLISVITSLSMDHTSILGDTLPKIAFEKAGIIKPGKPVVLSPQRDEARKVIEQVAQERHSPLVEVGRDYLFVPWSHSLDGQTFLVWQAADQARMEEYMKSGGRQTWQPLRLSTPLLGYHQAENGVTAYAALQFVRQSGLSVPDEAIRTGFENVSWPGRFELLRSDPPLIVDSAHNRDSALRLRQALDDYLPGKPIVLIFGASDDKDITGMFTELLPRVREVIMSQSVHPRAAVVEKLASLAQPFGKPVQTILPVEDALEAALRSAGQGAVVLATGSLFIAAAVRSVWKARTEQMAANEETVKSD